jgi:hypothetical protein
VENTADGRSTSTGSFLLGFAAQGVIGIESR